MDEVKEWTHQVDFLVLVEGSGWEDKVEIELARGSGLGGKATAERRGSAGCEGSHCHCKERRSDQENFFLISKSGYVTGYGRNETEFLTFDLPCLNPSSNCCLCSAHMPISRCFSFSGTLSATAAPYRQPPVQDMAGPDLRIVEAVRNRPWIDIVSRNHADNDCLDISDPCPSSQTEPNISGRRVDVDLIAQTIDQWGGWNAVSSVP